MRVLMVSKACLVGAYQSKLEEIAKFDDVELEVIVPPSWQDPAGAVPLERCHTDGYRLHVDPIRFNGRFHLHYYPLLKRRLRDFEPDILHMDEEPYNLATWLAVRQARAVGAHSLFFSWQNIQRRYPFPFYLMEKQVLHTVSYAIMGNEAAADVWRSKGYKGPLEVIPQFGVNPDLFYPRADRSQEDVVIGVAGRRLVWEKGTDLLLRAAGDLPGRWQIRIFGEGPEEAALAHLARELGIGDRVQFAGVLSSTRIADALRQIDILVLPSRTLPNWKEQFGRVLVEAMASGVAVVGSDSGEIPNVIGSAGLVFPEEDAGALRTHLQRLLESEALRAKLGRQGRSRVMNHYTQNQIALRTVAVYREMIASAG